jgi:hypothetical protein
MKNGVKSVRPRLGRSDEHGLVTPLMRQPVTKLREAIRGVFARAAVEAFLAATVTAAAEEDIAKSDNDSSDLTPTALDRTSQDTPG